MNDKHLFGYAILFAALIAGFLYAYKPQPANINLEPPAVNFAVDPLNATYILEEDIITLNDGRSEIRDSYGLIKTNAWNRQPALGDLNNDGVDDAALILTLDPGGSGTFFYAVAAIGDPKNNKTIGTNGILLGDRVAPQNISINEGKILINYADRKEDDPMTAAPTVGVSKYFRVVDNKLIEDSMKSVVPKTTGDLPSGYSADEFSVEKVQVESFCIQDSECATPEEYLLQSRCPFTSKCLYSKCVVVCPRALPANR